MIYIVAPEGACAYTVNHGNNILWDYNHLCPAHALTPDEAAQFGVHPLTEVPAPAFDPATQTVDAVDPAPVNGVWTQQWAVRAATQAEIDAYAAQQAAAVQSAAEAKAKTEAKADSVIKYLVTHTPAEIAAKVGTDVTSLAAAKTYIAKLAVAVSVLARKELR